MRVEAEVINCFPPNHPRFEWLVNGDTAETIRQVGGWSAVVAGAKAGGPVGVLAGSETGLGSIISGFAGALNKAFLDSSMESLPGWRQGNSEFWLTYVWKPFWFGLSDAEQEQYLDRWMAPDDWRQFMPLDVNSSDHPMCTAVQPLYILRHNVHPSLSLLSGALNHFPSLVVT